MKRILIFFSLLASIFALNSCSLCSLCEYYRSYYADWYIKNTTSNILKITGTVKDDKTADNETVLPGDSVTICSFLKFTHQNEYPAFSDFSEYENVHIEVFSENGDLMLSWDNNTETGKQSDFFKEESWRRFHTEDFYSMWWVYDINPEEIDASMKD